MFTENYPLFSWDPLFYVASVIIFLLLILILNLFLSLAETVNFVCLFKKSFFSQCFTVLYIIYFYSDLVYLLPSMYFGIISFSNSL